MDLPSVNVINMDEESNNRNNENPVPTPDNALRPSSNQSGRGGKVDKWAHMAQGKSSTGKDYTNRGASPAGSHRAGSAQGSRPNSSNSRSKFTGK